MRIAVTDGGRYSIEAGEDELRLIHIALSDLRPAAEERKLRTKMIGEIDPHVPEQDDLVPTDEELDDEGEDLLDELGGG